MVFYPNAKWVRLQRILLISQPNGAATVLTPALLVAYLCVFAAQPGYYWQQER